MLPMNCSLGTATMEKQKANLWSKFPRRGHFFIVPVTFNDWLVPPNRNIHVCLKRLKNKFSWIKLLMPSSTQITILLLSCADLWATISCRSIFHRLIIYIIKKKGFPFFSFKLSILQFLYEKGRSCVSHLFSVHHLLSFSICFLFLKLLKLPSCKCLCLPLINVICLDTLLFSATWVIGLLSCDLHLE